MATSKRLAIIKELVRKAPAHKTPTANVLNGELRSDNGIDPEEGAPGKSTEVPCAPNIVIVWTYAIGLDEFDAFHDFLHANEGALAEEVSNLGIGATYRGTYLQLTHGNPHRTYWGYPSIAAIEQFKDALKDKNSDLRDVMSTLTSFITDPALTLHREQRAGFHAGFVKKNKKKDPILDLLTQAAGKASRRP